MFDPLSFLVSLYVLWANAAAFNLEDCDLLDLTFKVNNDSIRWPNARPFLLETIFNGFTPQGFYYEAYNFETAEHLGTHLDAPKHFADNVMTVDQMMCRLWHIETRLRNSNSLVEAVASNEDAGQDGLMDAALVGTVEAEMAGPAGEDQAEAEEPMDEEEVVGDVTTCIVCMEEVTEPTTTGDQDCLQSFCLECMEQWLDRAQSCPICRAPADSIVVNGVVMLVAFEGQYFSDDDQLSISNTVELDSDDDDPPPSPQVQSIIQIPHVTPEQVDKILLIIWQELHQDD